MKKKRRQNPSAAPASPPAEPASEAESFGPWLRRQREVRQIELSDIALESKISRRYLEALESNRFEVLPAAIFTKGFLRQYATYVGLDAEEVVNFYLLASAEALEQAAEEVPDELRVAKRRGPNLGVGLVLLLLVLVTLAGLGFWWLSSGDGFSWSKLGFGGDSATGDDEQTELSSSAPVNSPITSGAAGPGALGGASDTESTTSNALAGAETGSQALGAATPEGSPAGPLSEGEELGADAKAIRVIVDFTGDCWVEASSDGQNRISEVRVQGESLRLEGDTEVYLKVGDIGAVRLEVNGETFQPEAASGSVRTMIFDRDLVEQLSLSQPAGQEGAPQDSGGIS